MANKVGHLAFLGGVAVAIIAGILPLGANAAWIQLILVLAGLVVGFLNVTAKETSDFLIAAVALLAANAGGKVFELINVFNIGMYLNAIVGNIAVFVAPAAVIVALKAVNELAKD